MTSKLTTDWVDLDFDPLDPPHPHFTFQDKVGFLCKPLTAPQFLNATATAQAGLPGDAAAMMIRDAVRDWRGVYRNGEPVKFSAKALGQFFEDARLIEFMGELGKSIGQRSILTEDETKNSSRPSDAQSDQTGQPAAAATA